MAAMVASHPHQHHAAMWDPSRRPEHAMHIAPLQIPSMAPGTDQASAASRSYQHSPMHMQHMPSAYAPSSYGGPLSYQSNEYVFNVPQPQHFSIPQQPFNIQHAPSLIPSNSYAPSIVDVESTATPVVRDLHHAIPTASRTPSVKADTPSPLNESPNVHIRSKSNSEVRNLESDEQTSAHFSTEIDCLMRTIQAQQPADAAKSLAVQEPRSRKQAVSSGQVAMAGAETGTSKSKPKKQYFCSEPGCRKTFCQKTHLDIHLRSHTGYKPFVCHAPNCGAQFSQLGNLKTHERRHTGERPFQCDICGKTFAQRGNVRAHRIVHENKKPFICKLDDCGKQFTQLGNLKSHQNKFHADTVRYLTQKFTNLREGEVVSSQDKEMWKYFAELYKNSNKGIKGRGKDRKIAAVTSPDSTITSFAPISSAGNASTAAPAMSRATTNGSIPPRGLGRTSRSSSHTTIPPYPHLDAHQQPVRPMHHEMPPVFSHPYSDAQHYDAAAYAQHKYA